MSLRFLLSVAVLLGAPASWAGGIYKYVEPDGTIVYTNVAPGRKGAKARRVDGEFRPAPSPRSPARVSSDSRKTLTQFDADIEDAARRYRIPVNLVRAVMHAESAFNATAISRTGASGLMQLMPDTARDMFVRDIFSPRENIEGGVRYLRVLTNEFDGDMVKIVAAYNAGPEAVKKYGGQVPPYAETQAYVRKVLNLYYQYKAADELARAEQN